jgi:hypothetical protein
VPITSDGVQAAMSSDFESYICNTSLVLIDRVAFEARLYNSSVD